MCFRDNIFSATLGSMARTDAAQNGGRHSFGLLMYRGAGTGLEVLIAHPGGPLWARKDDGAWSVPKGLPEVG